MSDGNIRRAPGESDDLEQLFNNNSGNVWLRTRSAGKEYLENITAQANVKGRALGATTISAAPPDQTALRDLKPTSSENPREVFLVHGHDEATREKVARFLERLHLEPIILHEQPNRGRTVIEKFEDHSKVCYAIVLLTADDVGGPWKSNDRLPRARQNVIFEHGYFVGLLGRRHVCALRAEGVEIPSDLAGVVYIDLDQTGDWKLRLARELKAAGLEIDMNLAVAAP